ncbi:MAG: hypothetical protein AVDCRST_MAG37-52 [uncultured Rubrobacteraceae bacterium]|uniref:Uncharacterized protein n=1 Tax=uncultured Rubrobacteraceae bacterium TaxID=349277 RepID=A0A6J4PUR5_9ACTN|nr:MAG: hypothetical protein AVDCRST_MAG37-52 [uncultured Rubrobacteraceae bacterium]
MEQRLLAQGAGTNNIINVYSDRIELRTGWQSENIVSLRLKQVANVTLRGMINCTLTLEINDGRRLNVERMALPDARQVKATIESQKQRAGLYE